MCMGSFACLTFALAAYFGGPGAVASSAEPAPPGEERAATDYGRERVELAAHIRKVLAMSTTRDLDRLATDIDSTVSLSAGWERLRQTIPEDPVRDAPAEAGGRGNRPLPRPKTSVNKKRTTDG